MPRDLVAFPETKPELDEDGRVLMRAAEIIEEDGWWQSGRNDSFGHGNSACAAIAIGRASLELHLPFIGAIDRVINLLGQDIMFWNDAIGRTAVEVTALLRQAALGLRP